MSQRPRVLVCTETFPPQITGSAVVVGHLLSGTSGGADYLVATAERRPASLAGIAVVSRDLPRAFYRRDLRVGLSDFARILSRPILFRAFRRAAAEFRPNLVLSIYPPDRFAILGDRLAAALGVPHAIHFHNLWEEALRYTAAHGGSAADRLRARAAPSREREIVGRAAGRFALTEAMARFLGEKHRLPFSPLPHAFPPAPPAGGGAAAREAGGRLDLVLPGTLYGMHASALRSLLEVVSRRDDAKLTLTTWLPKAYLASIGVVEGPAVAIAHFPDRERFFRRIGEADACVVCLAAEGHSPEDVATSLPTRLVESLRFGRPVLAVAPPDSWAARLVRDADAGMAVAPGDPAGISRAIDLLRDAAARRRFSGNARTLFDVRFSLERIGPRWLAEATRLARQVRRQITPRLSGPGM